MSAPHRPEGVEWSLLPGGALLLDDALVVVAANHAMLDLAARPEPDVVGRPIGDLLSAGGRIMTQTHLLPMLRRTGRIDEVALDVVTPDGTRVPVLVSATRDGDVTPAVVRALVVEVSERRRYESDLLRATREAESARAAADALAVALQATLIPPAPPVVEHLDIAAGYRPAGDGNEVGGDFYDVFQTGGRSWVVVLGDVSGKGALAAAVTASVRHHVRALAMQHADPSEVLRHLDRTLADDPTDHFCTLALGRLDLLGDRWRLDVSLAGHPPPLLRRTDGSVVEVGEYGTPVGLLPRPEFGTVSLDLLDETVTFYTDGVTEAQGPSGMLGEDGLARLVAGAPHDARAITEAVVEGALAHQVGLASDDIAVLTLSPRLSRLPG